jgi:glycyl-tRNA synthetase
MPVSIENIVSLCKRRGFVYPGSEIYGGLANSWDYGPLGVELKNNIKQMWWNRFVHRRDDMVGIDAALIMNTKVWEASGHLKEFKDPLVECKKCHKRFRADDLKKDNCPDCGEKNAFDEAKDFNLMLKTHLGPLEDSASAVYFRPETAQSMFVDFKNIVSTTRKTLPFGIAQIGKAFRNEITPGNFIFRTREFEQMEIEYFIREEDWQKYFEHWRKEMMGWMEDIGIDLKYIHELEVPAESRAHYSKRTIDFEYDFPFGKKELYGLAYRTDFDLRSHDKFSGENLKYKDQQTNEEFWPHVIEPTWGVDRSVLAVLCSAYSEEGERKFLKLTPQLAPYKAAVFPLMANKDEIVDTAQKIYKDLRKEFMVAWDDRGNVGKRYYSQDEIGTPYCITIDYQTLEDGTVTVRDRDTAKQERISKDGLSDYIDSKIKQ